MAARFGRRKRRAARAAVAAAQAHAAWTSEYYGKRVREADSARMRAEALLAEICERIVRACGSESALLPIPVQLKMGERYGTPIRWPLRNQGRDIDGFILAEPRETFFAVQEHNYAYLLQLVMKVESDPVHFRALIRFVNEHEKHGVGGFTERRYMASREALRELGPELDFRYFAEEVTHRLLTLQSPEQRARR